MKTAINMLMVLFVSITVIPAFAQLPANTISVNASAEKIVEADEILASIVLQEYSTGDQKVMISQLEGDLMKAAKELGIATGDILIENIAGYSNYQYETPDFLVSKTFQVKVKSIDALNKLVAKIGGQGMTSLNVMNFNNSKKNEHLNELKAKAIANAKAEASTLAAAVGKKLGDVVNVEVFQDYGATYYYEGGYTPFFGSAPASKDGKVAMKPITLRYSVRVVYAIM